jgi:hypothetical protein
MVFEKSGSHVLVFRQLYLDPGNEIEADKSLHSGLSTPRSFRQAERR